MQIEFTKYQGLGNDFILIDNRDQTEPKLTPQQAIQWCDHHFGIGGDGVIFILPGQQGADYTMRIFNSDGSEPEMCGNGIRCMARFIVDLEARDTAEPITYTIHTLAGLIKPELLPDGQVRVDMGRPRLAAADIPTTLAANGNKVVDMPLTVAGKTWTVTCISMGNPHCITFVEDADRIDLTVLGLSWQKWSYPKFVPGTKSGCHILSGTKSGSRIWSYGTESCCQISS